MSHLRVRNRNKRLRKDSRTVAVPGSAVYGNGKDRGRYYRCWNCGFICDTTRDDHSGGHPGISYEIFSADYSSDNNSTPDGAARQKGDVIHGENNGVALLSVLSVRSGHVCMENGADGEPKEIYRLWRSVVTAGCPFCGTRNYRGDF